MKQPISIILNTDSVPHDNELHTVWTQGNLEIKAYSGEFERISYRLYVDGHAHYCSYNLHDIRSEIEKLR